MGEPQQTDAESQDSSLSALGFGKSARRNLAVAIMTIQFGAIGFLFQQNSQLNKEIVEIFKT